MSTILITGATGYIGSQVLQQALAHPAIARVITLTRRPLPASIQSPKLTALILDDDAAWTAYPPAITAALAQVDGAVWALGSPYFRNLDTAHRVSTDYTLHGLDTLLHGQRTAPLHFVYVSGSAVVRDQDKKLLLMPGLRKARGRTENECLAAADRYGADKLQLAVARPGIVTAKSSAASVKALFVNNVAPLFAVSVAVEQLAAALLEFALHGDKGDGRIVENNQLRDRGQAVLDKARI